MRRTVAAIIIILVAIFFLLPFVPYSFASFSFSGETVSVTATVSPSYCVLGCGIVWQPVVHGGAGVELGITYWTGGRLMCGQPTPTTLAIL